MVHDSKIIIARKNGIRDVEVFFDRRSQADETMQYFKNKGYRVEINFDDSDAFIKLYGKSCWVVSIQW